MNKKEIIKVLDIISAADGGCPFCVKNLLDKFVIEFPGHKDITKDYYKKNTKEFKKMKEIIGRK